MPVSPKQKQKPVVHKGSLEAAGWLESKVSEKEFKEYQAFVREAMDRLAAEFASHQKKVDEKITEIEERLDQVEYAEDLSDSSEIFGGNDKEEEEGESFEGAGEDSDESSSSSSESSSDSGDSESDQDAYDREKFERYNQPQPGPHSYPWEQKKMSFQG